MLKAYDQWLVERNLQQPITVEYDAGKIEVFADPDAENWVSEIPKTEYYRNISKELKTAVDKKDTSSVKRILSELRDQPLFGQDKSTLWKAVQIDGAETKDDTEYIRTHAAMYAIKKIGYFLSWVK